MIEQIDARLLAFPMANLTTLADVDFDLARERTAQLRVPCATESWATHS